MALLDLQEQLKITPGKNLRVKINDNYSTMLSVKWKPKCTEVSLHRMFLDAPKNIMQELACYIRQESQIISPKVKAFIEDNLKKLDYSHTIDPGKLFHQGNVYNLRKIYDEINQEYFQNKLNLHITWFGKPNQKNKTRVTFGLYHEPLRLIKIHRLMDTPSIPYYVIKYVIYHEMLHHVCPAYVDERGLHHVHPAAFKKEEVKFRHYDLAQTWIKEHQAYLFD
jgi:hypothetical protein